MHIATVQHVDYTDNKAHSVYSLLADNTHSIEVIKIISVYVKSITTLKKVILDSNICSLREEKKDTEMLRFAIDIESCFTLEQSDIDRHTNHAWGIIGYGDWPDAFEVYIRATGAPFQHVAIRGKLKGRSQLDRLHQLSPLLSAAQAGNLNMVRFFLDKDRIIAAYEDFAAHNEFFTRKGSIEQSRREFLNAVEKWIGDRGKYFSALH